MTVSLRDYEYVRRELGTAEHESIYQAALRVFRQNCAPKPTLDCARIVLELRPTSPTVEQWKTIRRAASILRAAHAN